MNKYGRETLLVSTTSRSEEEKKRTTRLVLARHGQTDWNLEGRYQGHTDPPLNATGRAQAETLAEQLVEQPFKAIYSSNLRRAYETASTIAEKLGQPVQIDERLSEVRLGQWEGMLFSDIIMQYPSEWEQRQRDPAHWCPPGGETAAELSVRTWAAVDEIARRHAPGPVLIISHGLALATVVCRARDVPLSQLFEVAIDNAHPIEVDWVYE
jgi:broad specificity phosphatase PhoE